MRLRWGLATCVIRPIASCHAAASMRDFRVHELARYIDWGPLFQTWDLHGAFPKILEDEVVGDPQHGPALVPFISDYILQNPMQIRWALLIVRELILGPKRFSDLQAGLPRAGAKVLTVSMDLPFALARCAGERARDLALEPHQLDRLVTEPAPV